MKKYIFMMLSIFLTPKSLSNHYTITLVTEHLPPYQEIHENGSITGFSTEVVQETFKRAKITYSLQGFPWVRTYNLALKKKDHCIFSIARIPSREDKFIWIGSITEQNNAVVWALKDNKNAEKVKTLNDLKQFTTAVNQDDVTHTGMLEIGLTEGKNLYVLHHNKSLVTLLRTRPEIDFIVADDITFPYRTRWAGISMNEVKRVIEVKNLPLNFYLACNKNTDKNIVNELSSSLKSIHKDGTYKKILHRWTSDFPSY